jgi:hypothetical protein|tara:strand:- start:410 stop:841 length:432 start_codon:yes stop_codon:yes gene_type:complete
MDESKRLRLLEEFRNQLVNFLDELIDQFPMESDFVLIRMFIKDQVPVTDILGRFIRDLLPLKDIVHKRNEQFFLENTILYTGGNIKTDKVDHFKKLWQSDTLDECDRKIIWDWMDLFMRIAGSYDTNFGQITGWERNKEKIFF